MMKKMKYCERGVTSSTHLVQYANQWWNVMLCGQHGCEVANSMNANLDNLAECRLLAKHRGEMDCVQLHLMDGFDSEEDMVLGSLPVCSDGLLVNSEISQCVTVCAAGKVIWTIICKYVTLDYVKTEGHYFRRGTAFFLEGTYVGIYM